MTAFARHYSRWIFLICCAVFVGLAGCRRLPEAGPQQRPTITPTPRSTHLPPVPTPIPVGASNNPIHVVFPRIKSGSSQGAVTSAVEDLQTELSQATGLTVDVRLVDSDAEALAALCESTPDDISAAWVGGVAYAAAYAEDCGTAALQISRGTLDQATTGSEVALYGNRSNGVNSLDELANKTLCRLSVDDLYTWLIPSVLLRTSDGDLSSSLKEVRDYDDLDSLIAALADGDCDAAGMNIADFEERANASARSATGIIARSPEIPYFIMILPSYLPLGQASGLIDAFMTIGNGARSDLLRPIIQQDQLARVDDPDFARLRTFFSQARLDLSELGQ